MNKILTKQFWFETKKFKIIFFNLYFAPIQFIILTIPVFELLFLYICNFFLFLVPIWILSLIGSIFLSIFLISKIY